MDCITVLPLRFIFENIDITIYPALLSDSNGLTLIDCGYPQFLPKVEAAIIKAGFQMKDVVKIIITHHDHDHMGALKEITDKFPAVEIICSKVQQPYITGEAKSLRLIQAEEKDKFLTAEEKVESRKFMDMIKSVRYAKTVFIVEDGDFLPICGGLELIDTSGHMPGHISLYSPSKKTLIAGDALVIEDGRLCIANPEYVLDMPTAIESVKKLTHYDIEKIICYHGGIYTHDVKSALKKILHDNADTDKNGGNA